jgi:hypothetical protein
VRFVEFVTSQGFVILLSKVTFVKELLLIKFILAGSVFAKDTFVKCMSVWQAPGNPDTNIALLLEQFTLQLLTKMCLN